MTWSNVRKRQWYFGNVFRRRYKMFRLTSTQKQTGAHSSLLKYIFALSVAKRMEFSQTSKTNPAGLTVGESLPSSLSQHVASSSKISGSECSRKQWSLSTDSYPICCQYKWMRLIFPPLSRIRMWDLYSKWRQDGMVNGDWQSFFWQRTDFSPSKAHGVGDCCRVNGRTGNPTHPLRAPVTDNDASAAHISLICVAEISGREEQENGRSSTVWIYASNLKFFISTDTV